MPIAFKQNCAYVFILLMAVVTSVGIYRGTHQAWISLRAAEIQYEKKNFKEAIELYEISLQEGLPKAQLSLNLPNSYFALGQFDKAIPFYKEYLSMHPKDTGARLTLAKALSWVGNTKDAEEQYKKIFEEKDVK